MQKEDDDLRVKIEALRTFIYHNPVFDTLTDEMRTLLIKQEEAMTEYSRILECRKSILVEEYRKSL